MQWRRAAERTRDGFTWTPSRTRSFLREGRRWYGGQPNDAKIPETKSAEVGGGGVEKRRAAGSFARDDDCAGRAVYPDEKSPKSRKYDSDADCDAARIFADASKCSQRDCGRRHGRGDCFDGAGRSREAGAVAETIDGTGAEGTSAPVRQFSGFATPRLPKTLLRRVPPTPGKTTSRETKRRRLCVRRADIRRGRRALRWPGGSMH